FHIQRFAHAPVIPATFDPNVAAASISFVVTGLDVAEAPAGSLVVLLHSVLDRMKRAASFVVHSCKDVSRNPDIRNFDVLIKAFDEVMQSRAVPKLPVVRVGLNEAIRRDPELPWMSCRLMWCVLGMKRELHGNAYGLIAKRGPLLVT